MVNWSMPIQIFSRPIRSKCKNLHLLRSYRNFRILMSIGEVSEFSGWVEMPENLTERDSPKFS